MRENKKRGMTLLEVAISVTILTAVTAGALRMAESTTKAIGTGTAASDLDFRAQTALSRLGELVRTSSRTSLTPALPVAPPLTVETSDITYSRVTGIDDVALAPIWGLPEQLLLEQSPLDPADGIDNDGNGVVDDCRVVWIEDPAGANRRRIIVRDVAPLLDGEIAGNGADDNGNGLVDERGLSFDMEGSKITVRLELERPDPDGVVRRTVKVANVTCRN